MNRLRENLNVFTRELVTVNVTETAGGSVQPKNIQFGGLDITDSLRKTIIDGEKLNSFYENSYKCNVGNRLKNYIHIINDVNEYYANIEIDNNDNINDVLIKIIIKNIHLFNDSYYPAVNENQILSSLNNVDLSYTVEQMNAILNLYSDQFTLYSLINTIMNSDFTENRQLLIDLFNENISDDIFIQLKLPFTKLELLQSIIENKLPEKIIQQPDSYYKKLDLEKLKLKNYSRPSQSFVTSNFSRNRLATQGGSIKNKRKNIRKTKNNKRYSKKHTIKKKNVKTKKYTRRN